MILLDTETTNGIKSQLLPLDQQPEVIELGAVKLDDTTLEEIASVSWLIKPRVLPLSKDTTKYTNITTEMVEGQPSFARRVPELTNFFLGERKFVAHNVCFDVDVIFFELSRLGLTKRFPWPPEHIDTVELSMDLDAPRQKSSRLKLGELYLLATGTEMPVKHRALDDARALIPIVKYLRGIDGRI